METREKSKKIILFGSCKNFTEVDGVEFVNDTDPCCIGADYVLFFVDSRVDARRHFISAYFNFKRVTMCKKFGVVVNGRGLFSKQMDHLINVSEDVIKIPNSSNFLKIVECLVKN